MSKEMEETLWVARSSRRTNAPAVYQYGSVVDLAEQRTLAAAQERLDRLRGLARMRPWDAELAAMVEIQEARVASLAASPLPQKKKKKKRRAKPAEVVKPTFKRTRRTPKQVQDLAEKLIATIPLEEVEARVREFNDAADEPVDKERVDGILEELFLIEVRKEAGLDVK